MRSTRRRAARQRPAADHLLDIPRETTIAKRRCRPNGDLAVTFSPEGKTVIFPVRLAQGAHLRQGERGGAGWTSSEVELWDSRPASERAGRLLRADQQATAARSAAGSPSVRRYGFAVLRDVPTESGTLCKVAELFGYVRETNYGRWFEVRAEVNPNNLAYTNLGLQAHTDNPYRDPVPTLQILACLENYGGGRRLDRGRRVCGRGAAEGGKPARLRSPHALSARASNMPARPACGFARKKPFIELSPDGELIAIRFNNRSAAPIVDVPYDDMADYLCRLSPLRRDPGGPGDGGDLQAAAGRALHRRQHARAACAKGVLRHGQTLAAGLLRRQGRAALHARRDRGGRAARRRPNERRSARPRDDRAVPRRDFRAARRGGISRRAGDDRRAHAAGREVRRGWRARSDELVAAALLHDIGHFTSEFGTYSPDDIEDKHHDEAGAEVLAPFFPPVVTECVRLHVAAKRYLCATDPSYFAKLSSASVHTLSLQGGPMSDAEVAAFRKNPFHDEAVRVRLWDEGGKVPGMKTRPFRDYEPLLQRVVDAHLGHRGA